MQVSSIIALGLETFLSHIGTAHIFVVEFLLTHLIGNHIIHLSMVTHIHVVGLDGADVPDII